MLHCETLSAVQHDRIVPKGRPGEVLGKMGTAGFFYSVEPWRGEISAKFVGKWGKDSINPLGVKKYPSLDAVFNQGDDHSPYESTSYIGPFTTWRIIE